MPEVGVTGTSRISRSGGAVDIVFGPHKVSRAAGASHGRRKGVLQPLNGSLLSPLNLPSDDASKFVCMY